MAEEYRLRRPDRYLPEQAYLQENFLRVEKNLGRVAARLGQPTPITSPLDALDRARELTSDLGREVTVRGLEEAIGARLSWLDRAEAHQAEDDPEPRNDLNRIALDRVLLRELLAGWTSGRN